VIQQIWRTGGRAHRLMIAGPVNASHRRYLIVQSSFIVLRAGDSRRGPRSDESCKSGRENDPW
jgi:hypothetical protein